MKPNRARVLRNWSLEEPGALVVYPGFKSFSTTSLGAGRAQGGERVYLKNSVFTIVAFGGSVYKPSDAGVWSAAVLTGLSGTKEIFFPYDQDLAAVFDETNVPKKSTDGTIWTQMGISVPASAPTLALVAGGGLIAGNVYEVSYTYKDDELSHEGNTSPAAEATPSGGNLVIRCTIPRSTDSQVDTIVVYVRNKTAGETVRRKVGTVANPGAGSATFDIDGPDSDWATGDEVPTDHNVPVALAFGTPWKNRWWARDATVKIRIRFTQIFQNQSWPALFFIDIPVERGDEITALIPQGDSLVVWTHSSKPYVIIGQTSLDFEVKPLAGAESGALGPRTVKAIENGILHAAADGVYIFDGATDRLLTYDISPGWQDLVVSATAADLARIAIVYHRKRKEVRIAVPRLYPFGAAGEWILDLNRSLVQEEPAWTSTDRFVGGYIHWDGKESVTGNRGRLFTWHLSDGKLFEEATGTDADGADMVADYEGPTLSRGFLMTHFYDLWGEYQPAGGSFAVEAFVDGKSLGSQTVDIGAGLAKYGTAVYGTDVYAGADRKMFAKMLPLSAEGRSLKLKAKYTGKDQYRWFTYGASLLQEPVPRGIGA